MLSLLYVAILAVPLTLAATALLAIALRGADRRLRERDRRRGPAALAPLTDVVRRALEADPPDPPQQRKPALAEPRPVIPEAAAPPLLPVAPLPPGVPTKVCPACAETVLEAARICRHCRHRFDGAALDDRLSA